MSLDGFIAPEERADDPDLQRWMAQWMELQSWVFPQRFFRESLELGEGGETGRDNTLIEETFSRTGVSIMGKRMFDGVPHPGIPPHPSGARALAPSRQHDVHALRQAREAAGQKDIRIGGGADVIQQYLDAGLIDEFTISLAPVLFGTGVRLFDGIDPTRLPLTIEEAIDSPEVTHLRYRVLNGDDQG